MTRFVLLSLSLVAACSPATRSSPPFADAATPPDPDEPTKAEPPTILSAHLGVINAPPLQGLDGLPVVFSAEVDAASLTPARFLVRLDSGARVVPKRALLAPANEADENRTVLLLGPFEQPIPAVAEPPTAGVGDIRDQSEPAATPSETPEGSTEASEATEAVERAAVAMPTHVVVIGPLYAEDGRSLKGLGASVLPFDSRGSVVLAQAATNPEVCGGSPFVRTYWIDGLRGVETSDLERIAVTTSAGEVAPTGFDDHDLSDQSREDNVLDLCLPGETTGIERLSVDAETFTDPPGHPSAAVDVPVVSAMTASESLP